MLISEDRLFLFVHVPKTGGTSLESILKPYALPRPGSKFSRWLRPLGLPRDHRGYRFRQHGSLRSLEARLPTELFERCFKFAFVRNPWDRLVSDYNHACSNPQSGRHRKIAKRGFGEFLAGEARRADSKQLPLLLNQRGELGVDYLGRFEQFAAHANHVLEQIGVQAELPHRNAHPHEDYRQLYDDRTEAFVAKHWREDIEQLGYRFEG